MFSITSRRFPHRRLSSQGPLWGILWRSHLGFAAPGGVLHARQVRPRRSASPGSPPARPASRTLPRGKTLRREVEAPRTTLRLTPSPPASVGGPVRRPPSVRCGFALPPPIPRGHRVALRPDAASRLLWFCFQRCENPESFSVGFRHDHARPAASLSLPAARFGLRQHALSCHGPLG
jgi:hypothetical protein